MGYFYNMSTVYIGVATPFIIDTEALTFFVFCLVPDAHITVLHYCVSVLSLSRIKKNLSRAQLGLFVEHILSLT